eukprot:561384-Hanusia_phi.AAC.1
MLQARKESIPEKGDPKLRGEREHQPWEEQKRFKELKFRTRTGSYDADADTDADEEKWDRKVEE